MVRRLRDRTNGTSRQFWVQVAEQCQKAWRRALELALFYDAKLDVSKISAKRPN
jgi:hypothetical protein